jgi:hypothetical protein
LSDKGETTFGAVDACFIIGAAGVSGWNNKAEGGGGGAGGGPLFAITGYMNIKY